MYIYGYESDDGELISLKEITLKASINELYDLVSFLKNTIITIEGSDGNFGHEHFSDFAKDSYKGPAEIIVMLDSTNEA